MLVIAFNSWIVQSLLILHLVLVMSLCRTRPKLYQTGQNSLPSRTLTGANWRTVEGSSCCVDVLFTEPDVVNLSQLENCDVLMLPETQAAGPYFNPLFFLKDTLCPMYSA